jgi:hypothetical protein
MRQFIRRVMHLLIPHTPDDWQLATEKFVLYSALITYVPDQAMFWTVVVLATTAGAVASAIASALQGRLTNAKDQ